MNPAEPPNYSAAETEHLGAYAHQIIELRRPAAAPGPHEREPDTPCVPSRVSDQNQNRRRTVRDALLMLAAVAIGLTAYYLGAHAR